MLEQFSPEHTYLLACIEFANQRHPKIRTVRGKERKRTPILCPDCRQDMVGGAHVLIDLNHECRNRYLCKNGQMPCDCK